MRRLKMFFSVVVMALIIILAISYVETSKAETITDAAFASKIATLKTKFVHGEYWNYYNSSDLSKTGSIPCKCSGYCTGDCTCQCGQFYYNGTWYSGQCYAYADTLGNLIFGGNPHSWNTHSDASHIVAGDIIRAYFTSAGLHTIFVYKVEGETVYFTDCNFVGPCQVRWNGTYTKSQIQGKSNLVVYHASNNACTTGTAQPTGITINSTNFPDTNFRNYVKGEVDRDKDGYLSDKEIKKTFGIECYFCSISSMKGIEYFTELESLVCVGNNLTKLDVSKCAKLRNLECGANKLTSLQVNSKLTYLDCGDNKLSGLNVRSCSKLETLLCEDNQLTSLDLSQNIKLKHLHCENNKLASLNVSKNTRLYCLHCENNKLSSLNVSKNTKLEYLYCYNNRFITLDVSKCTVLAKYVKKESRGIGTEFDYFGLWIDDDGEYSEFRLIVDKTVTVKAGSTTRKASVINVKYKNGNYRLSGSTATLTGVTDKNLTSFTVADNIKDDGKTYKVTKIAASACKGLSKLTKLNIGKNVKEIGKNAFSNCKKLKTINFKGTALKKIGSDAFKNIAKKATFNIPQKVYKNYKKLIKDAGTSSAEYKKD